MTDVRNALLEFLQTELVGPSSDDEVLDSSPCQRYSAGVLFPRSQPVSQVDDLSDLGEPEVRIEPEDIPLEADRQPDEARLERTEVGETGPELDEVVLLANSFLPSAMGLTFLVSRAAQALDVTAHAAVYRSVPRDAGFREWVRHPLEIPALTVPLLTTQPHGSSERDLHEGRLTLKLVDRRRRDGSHLVTVTLFNKASCFGSGPPRADACYFQTGFLVRADTENAFLALPGSPRSMADQEELSLEMLYRKHRTFARGHGCAAAWQPRGEGASVAWVETSTLPSVELPMIRPRSELNDQTSMEFLGGQGLSAPAREIPAALKQLTASYRDWIDELPVDSLPKRYRESGCHHISRCGQAENRIQQGIALLRDDPQVLRAFMLMNRAMLIQQHHNRRARRKPGAELQPLPSSYHALHEANTVIGYWRNFQLAFILMNLSAFTADENERYRDLVDLIWFPTGGGKTEAYLGLAAFSIFLRRLRAPSSAGVTVLMRYTLRLLTSQQFQRASSLICACDELRLADPEALGSKPISIGLWVGKSLTPNTRYQALEDQAKLEKQDPYQENTFQLLTCPWCGTALDEEPLGYRRLRADGHLTVRLLCPERSCAFSTPARPLPVLVIDDDIYDHPPTLVISTVDKFAMLAWRPETGALFGSKSNAAPELIIQDELHLISGPLGSMVGLYESFIDLLCTQGGRPPKIVVSTATIRRAKEQCRALYDREAVQFPPPGLDITDSWFAAEDASSPGRMYVGVLPAAAPSPVTALVRTAAALLQGVKTIPAGEEALRDPYWTLVQYFGSLRELGRASTLIDADIPEHIKVIARRRGLTGDQMRWLSYPVELTSRRTASEIPRILEQLEISYPSDDKRPLDALLATNMISVGVDINRLGLMLVVGQPKSTSEYIQATSRVGRSTAAPGFVVTLYNAGKPRDRSHYEQFRGFHESFYRHVEPSSVTPYCLPVVDRALQALLVAGARHLQGASKPEGFDPESPAMVLFRDHLEQRARTIDDDPVHLDYLSRRLHELSARWRRAPPTLWGNFGQRPTERPLMYPAGSEPRNEWQGHSWPVPTSMRNVDAECHVQILQIYPEPEEHRH